MQVLGRTISVDDIVWHSSGFGLVRACCLSEEHLCAFVEVLAVVRPISQHSDVVRCTGQLALWEATEMHLTVAWRRSGGELHVVRM
jgi:hypothetical protein